MAYSGLGQYIRERLLAAGSKGVVCADLYAELYAHRKAGALSDLNLAPGLFRRMRLHSFYRYFHWLKGLDWIVETGKEEVGYQKGTDQELGIPRRYYRITAKGTSTPETYWANPLAQAHPEWGPGGDKKQAYMKVWWEAHRTGRPRGRPRTRPVIEKGPVGRPKKEKIEVADLTLEQKIEQATSRIKEYKRPNSLRAGEVLDMLKELGVDIDEQRAALEEYSSIDREEYDTAEEYKEAREEAWESFLETLDEIEVPEED